MFSILSLKTQYQTHKLILSFILFFSCFCQASDNADATTKQKPFQHTPFFFFQGGFGLAFDNSAQNTATKTNVIPSVTIALGFNHHFRIYKVSAGLKFMVDYETGLSYSGENTKVYKGGGAYMILYGGTPSLWKIPPFLLYGGVGYDFLDVGFTFLPSFDTNPRSYSYGPSYLYGCVIVLNSFSGIDISFRKSKSYNFSPRIFVSYEFRF